MKWFLLASILIGANSAWGQAVDSLRPTFDLDLAYNYQRIERTTTTNNINFLARTGGMVAFQYDQPQNLFTSFYIGGDVAYSLYEAPGSNQLDPTYNFPWQLFVGFGTQKGDSRDFEFSGGLGFSTEYYVVLTAFERYDLIEKFSLRAHLGISYRFLSMLGTNARLRVRYFYPLNKIEQGGTPLRFHGVLDSTIRLKFSYKASWSLYGGVRFEDYKVEDKTVTYFNTRIYAGLGLHF